MAKPYVHAKSSARKWGGVPEDYLEIHDFLDSSKITMADNRHRAILHHSFGVFLCEKLFGHNIKISTGNLISVRDIAEQHIAEDCNGVIPTVCDYLSEMTHKEWMNGSGHPPSANKLYSLEEKTKTTFTPFPSNEPLYLDVKRNEPLALTKPQIEELEKLFHKDSD